MNASEQSAELHCFSDEILRDFNTGRLQDPHLELRVSEHLGACDQCESRISSLPLDTIGRLLREPDPLEQPPESGQVGHNRAQASTRSLLKSHSENTDVGERVTASVPAETLPVRIDRYFVIRELGKGGFAQVYLAKDPDHDRQVAIKVPRPDKLNTKEARREFLKEARTVAVLEHPNIVPLYDCRELDDGRCIVVMKYIEGGTLQEAMKTERFDHRRSAKLVATIADALHYAHGQCIWHRDVKPANILLDKEGNPYLSDFGLAIHEDQQHLHANEVAGTYAYMSPEQILGGAGQLDGRSDVWSLGVVFYELLTRQRPFRGATLDQIRDAIQHLAPRPPGSPDRPVPHKLGAICNRCLKKNTEERYATAANLASDLRVFLRRRQRIVATLMASLVCLSVSGIAIGYARSDAPWTHSSESGRASQRSVGELNLDDDHQPKLRELKNGLDSADRYLVPLAWPTSEKNDFYKMLKPNGRVAIKSSSFFACFETNRPTAQHYRMRAEADLHSPHAAAGVVVGIHETSPSPKEFRCLVASVSSHPPLEGMWVTVEESQIRQIAFAKWELQGLRRIERFKLEGTRARNVRLEIEINDERVASMKYNGKLIEEVVAALSEVRVPDETRCGIVVKGHVVFHSINCEELAR